MAQQGSKTTKSASPASAPAQRSHPSRFWILRQLLKSINPRRLPIPVPPSPSPLHNKWIILTGGTSGIGFEAALQFARWGANIILGCRGGEGKFPPHEMHPDEAVKKLKEAAKEKGYSESVMEWWECDMGNLESVSEFGRRWVEGIGKDRALDFLVNNAGMAGGVPGLKMTGDGFELVHQINFLSHVLLTLILLPSLSKSPSPRIVCTTSCMQFLGFFDLSNANSGINSYANNKLYFQVWISELQARLSQSPKSGHIVIHGVHPGFVNTNIWVSDRPRRKGFLGWIWAKILKHVAIDSLQGSLAIVNAVTANEWSREGGQGGRYENRVWEAQPMPMTGDKECRTRLWEFVNEELKLVERGLLVGLEG